MLRLTLNFKFSGSISCLRACHGSWVMSWVTLGITRSRIFPAGVIQEELTGWKLSGNPEDTGPKPDNSEGDEIATRGQIFP